LSEDGGRPTGIDIVNVKILGKKIQYTRTEHHTETPYKAELHGL
jgi:hypothetical protein